MKTALSKYQDALFRLYVARIHKVEWLIAYVKARRTAFRSDNIYRGWRGAELLPFDSERILHQLKPKIRSTSNSQKHLPPDLPPATPQNVNIFDTSLVNSSPPNAVDLQRINTAFHR